MKISQRNDLAARKVLTNLNGLAKVSQNSREFSLEVYANGREQGFALSDWSNPISRKVAWSEWRCSDDIVVYFGFEKDFERNTNIPSDLVYKKAKFFEPGEYREAAKFIVSYLESK